MDKYDQCNEPVDTDAFVGRKCYGGLDLASSEDIAAFVLVFPPEGDDDKYTVLPYFWIPSDNIDRRVRRHHVPYDKWVKEGVLTATEGNVIQYDFIEHKIAELRQKYEILEVAFDDWGATQMIQNLDEMGGFELVRFRQGYKSLSPPSKEFMRLILGGNIRHGGHPVLRWCFDNVYVETDPAGNIKPSKKKSSEKIDGAVAAIMALDGALQKKKHGSVYDTRGLIILGSDDDDW